MLKACDLHKVYKESAKEVYAVRGISLQVKKGEILVIVGPSGAGKSTLLHLLGGLDRPDKGTVSLDGVDLYGIGDDARSRIRNRRIGFVFQFYHLLPELTALENVVLPTMIMGGGMGTLRSIPTNQARGLLETVGLGQRLDHKPPQLSGGEAQRVAIARALVNEPGIVFCDEPTGNLDSKMSEELCELIWRLNQEKRQAFVIVTHEPKLAEKATRILHIKDGILL